MDENTLMRTVVGVALFNLALASWSDIREDTPEQIHVTWFALTMVEVLFVTVVYGLWFVVTGTTPFKS